MLHRLLKDAAAAALKPLGLELRRIEPAMPFPEATADDRNLIAKFRSYTMTGDKRQWTLLKAIEYIEAAAVPGDIVECGVLRGGAMMLAKATLLRRAVSARKIHLFDTFTGMTLPTEEDISYMGESAIETFDERQSHIAWSGASVAEVKANFARYDLLDDNVVFCPGPVEETLMVEANLPSEIALLRLDTDWYESTCIELDVLWPRLAKGGVLLIDDYGHWEGARKAVDEYFTNRPILLSPVDYACRVAVKL